jgi:hypothetical protein
MAKKFSVLDYLLSSSKLNIIKNDLSFKTLLLGFHLKKQIRTM